MQLLPPVAWCAPHCRGPQARSTMLSAVTACARAQRANACTPCGACVQALALNPARGKHMLYSNLSAAQLQLGDKEAALQAAQAAVACAPRGFHMVGTTPAGQRACACGQCPAHAAEAQCLAFVVHC